MNAVSIIGVVTAFGLVFLWLLVLCAEKGIQPLGRMRRGVRRLPGWKKVLILIFVSVWIAFAGTKEGTNGVDQVEGETNTVTQVEGGTNVLGGGVQGRARSPSAPQGAANGESNGQAFRRVRRTRPTGMTPITDDDIAQMWRIGATVDGNAIAAPTANAVTNAAWSDYGGLSDSLRIRPAGWRFPFGTKTATGLTVFQNGEFRPNVKTHFFPPPFDARLSLLPRLNWGLLPDGGESVFWHEQTPSNSLVLTWHDALYGRDVNCPTNFQAELFADGRFDYRYPDHTDQYEPVFPFDLDGDGLENSVDLEPLVAGPDAHGTNAEWYNRVCGNVFSANEGGDGMELAPRASDVNTNAYYFVDVVAESLAPVYFTADGESRLGNPVLVARAGATNRVPLLIGAKYSVSSPVPLQLFAPAKALLEPTWLNGGIVYSVLWPSGLGYERAGDLYAPSVDEAARLGGAFSWSGGCCLVLDGTMMSFGCHVCGCGGCSTFLNYAYEGYVASVPGPVCGCSSANMDSGETPFVATDAGACVALGFSEPYVVLSDTNGLAGVVRPRSTRTVLTLAAWGGANGGVLTVEGEGLDRLTAVDGSMPALGNRVVAPGEMYAVVVTNEGVSASSRLEDVRISATLVENASGMSIRRNAHATVCAFTLEGLKFNHDSAACTNDAINIRLDGSTNGVYHIQDGEWTRGGATNCPACYVGGIRPVVKARFGARPADLASAVLGAEATGGGFVLGNLPPKRIAFSGGRSDWIDFDACGGTNAIPVCVRRQQGSWEWSVTNVQGRALAKFCVATSGPHKVYTVLAHPTAPWREAKDDPQCAWSYALERACGWAEGAIATNDMFVAVTSNLYYNCQFAYDTIEGGTRYWQNSKFDLSGYLARRSLLVNCYDQALALTSMGNLLGGDACPVYTSSFGLINTNSLIGVGLSNNPFFTGATNVLRIVVSNSGHVFQSNFAVPRTPLCDGDYVGRSSFGNHMYVRSSVGIFDACAGPVLGGCTHSEYLMDMIDHSTSSERENGFFSYTNPGRHIFFSSQFKFLW